MSTSATSGERPAAVLVLFVVFCFGALLFFALYGLQIAEVAAGRDRSATVLEVCGAIAALAVRCVGMTRLFFLKADSWLWLVVALVAGLPITILSIFHHRVLGSDLTAPILASIVQYLIAIGIIYYAYRLFHDVKKNGEGQPPA